MYPGETKKPRPEGGLDLSALARLPVAPGLCATCVHLRLLASPRSVFVRCALAAEDPVFPRYPPLPVVSCTGHRRRTLPPLGVEGRGC